MIYGMDSSVSSLEVGGGALINKELKKGMTDVCRVAKHPDMVSLSKEVAETVKNLLGIR